MTKLTGFFLLVMMMLPLYLMSNANLFADGPTTGEIVDGSGGRLQPAGPGAPFPSESGLTPPFTNLGQGNYRDANGFEVDLTGPDGQENFKFRNASDRTEANDADWMRNHRGKFPGPYQDWKDLQQYGGNNPDLWGNYDAFGTSGAQNMGSMNMMSGQTPSNGTITMPSGAQAVQTGEGGH